MDDDEFIRQLDVKLGKGSAGGRGRELEGLAMGVDVAPPPSADESDGSAEERGWVLARRAMLCVREIVRTEKSYQRHLIRLLESEVSSSLPSTCN